MDRQRAFLKLRSWLRTRWNHREIKGIGNKINVKNATLKSCDFNICGDNNIITIGEGTVAKNVFFYIRGSGSRIEIGRNCYLGEGSCLHIENSGSYLGIGHKTTVGEALFAVTEPNSKIIIGADCMIAHDIEIRCGDSHSILDMETGARINYAKNVCIKDHVWVGAYAKILKGVTVEQNCIVGLGAVVTKDIAANRVAAGNPAKEVGKGVNWCRERL